MNLDDIFEDKEPTKKKIAKDEEEERQEYIPATSSLIEKPRPRSADEKLNAAFDEEETEDVETPSREDKLDDADINVNSTSGRVKGDAEKMLDNAAEDTPDNVVIDRLRNIAAVATARWEKYLNEKDASKEQRDSIWREFNYEFEDAISKIRTLDRKRSEIYSMVDVGDIADADWLDVIHDTEEASKRMGWAEARKEQQEQIVSKFEHRWGNPGRKTKSQLEKELEKGERSSRVKKYRSLEKLQNLLNKAIADASKEFVDDPEGLDEFIKTASKDFAQAEGKLISILEKADEVREEGRAAASKAMADGEEVDPKYLEEYSNLTREATKIINELEDSYTDEEPKEVLDDEEFKTPQWYNKKFREYINEALSLPGAPASIRETFNNIAGYQPKFASARSKFADIKQLHNDQSLIKQVANGAKPIAHTKSVRRHVLLKSPDAQFLAYVLAPERMGGGAIWYRPYTQGNWKLYDKRIKGLDPESEKEDLPTRPYDPYKRDPNLDIVELYMWNNLSNKSDPRLYNFINGMCLGYHRHFIIWYCESKYGQIDHRQPERSLFRRMLDRMAYCMRANVDGYGRPGTIKPDGMFSTVVKLLTGQGINNMLDSIFGTAESYGVYRDFAQAAAEYPMPKDAGKFIPDDEEPGYNPRGSFMKSVETMMADINKKQSPIIESIFDQLDNL